MSRRLGTGIAATDYGDGVWSILRPLDVTMAGRRIIHRSVATFARTWGLPEGYDHVLANVATTARHAILRAMNNPG